MQKVGTDVIRKVKPDYWVDFLSGFLKLFPNEWDVVIIPDVRFPNEIDKMKHDGWKVFSLRVHRLDFESNLTDEQKHHISETALDNYDFDYVIKTLSGFEILKDSLEDMYKEELN